jgi:hypothetical protein
MVGDFDDPEFVRDSMTVEHKTVLPHPAIPYNHRVAPADDFQAWNFSWRTNHWPVVASLLLVARM